MAGIDHVKVDFKFIGYEPSFGFFERYDDKGNNFYKLKDKYRDPNLKDILLLTTGGTISQRRKMEEGELEPFDKGNLVLIEHMPRLGEHANIDIFDAGAIDSTNLHLYKTRGKLAETIYRNRYKYDGFSGTHGTDSMDVTAASLAFMLQDLGKPVVWTGSQFPIYDDPTDAAVNLTNSIISALQPFGEVAVYFGGDLLRGVSLVKVREENPRAFETPNDKTLGEWSLIGKKIRLDPSAIRKEYDSNTDAKLFTDFSEKIEYHDLQLGASFRAIRDSLLTGPENCEGVVIGGVGAGNIHNDLILDIETCVRKLKKPVYITTKCLTGSAQMGAYGPGAAAREAGARTAKNLTSTTAVVKLSYVTGRVKGEIESKLTEEDNKLQRIEQLMYKDFCGEFSRY